MWKRINRSDYKKLVARKKYFIRRRQEIKEKYKSDFYWGINLSEFSEQASLDLEKDTFNLLAMGFTTKKSKKIKTLR